MPVLLIIVVLMFQVNNNNYNNNKFLLMEMKNGSKFELFTLGYNNKLYFYI